MKRLGVLFWCAALLLFAVPFLHAADTPPPPADAATSVTDSETQKTVAVAAAAATAAARQQVHPPGFLEHLVDIILEACDVRTSGNTVTHYVIALVLLVGALVLRHVVTRIIFAGLKKLASKTETTLDDKLFPALEAPTATFIMLVGIFAALSVLKLSAESDRYIGYASTVAFSLAIFWGLLRAFNAVLDHAHEVARNRQMGIAAFMPWIKKTLVTLFVIVGVLLTAQSLGADVKAFLAGLGIGGLAFALAAQDTIANLFGSIVVAIDQPFKLGEAVKIGANEGIVEDIGLRSTKLRPPGKNLIIIPNKTVAAEAIINNSRFIKRRFEQVLGLTYAAKPDQMDAIVAELRRIIVAEAEVDKNSVMVFFRDLSASSLDIWVVYETLDPDFQKSMRLKQRVNLAMMRAVYAAGLSFAFPTQTIELAGTVAEKLADRGAPPRAGGN